MRVYVYVGTCVNINIRCGARVCPYVYVCMHTFKRVCMHVRADVCAYVLMHAYFQCAFAKDTDTNR